MKPIRTFIAIELPAELKQALASLIMTLRKSNPSPVKWVGAEKIHLTLAFLGDTLPNDVALATGCIDEAAAGASPFDLDVSGLGCFPDCSRPRVLWCGLHPMHQLKPLQANLSRCLLEKGFALENRAFSPHLTLARFSTPLDAASLHHLRHSMDKLASTNIGVLSVREIVLFKSDLRPQGAIYTPLYKSALKSAA